MKILLIEDDITVCSSLKLLLGKKGYTVDAVNQPNLAEDKINAFKPEIILLDMNFTIDTSGKQGLKLLRIIREAHPNISVILMTGWATVQLAVTGMKLGAKDFMTKPWDNKDLMVSIENIKSLHHGSFDNQPKGESRDSRIIGSSQQIKDVLSLVDRVAETEASVLITGESGTGKELIAEAIHFKSKRAQGPFVKVNLGALPETLFESELFGHKKGAFTGAHSDREGRFGVANNGTIFLDEIGELGLNSQVKLLRVLQEKSYEMLGSSETKKTNVRLLSATNKNLNKIAGEGKFREDLFYRINLINIHLPALRDRREDIPDLVNYFVKNIAELYETEKPYLHPNTIDWLSQQEYKGNIRQLKNIIERTFLLHRSKKELVQKDFLPSFQVNVSSNKAGQALNLQENEIETIRKALAKYDHSISSSARALGITRSSLYRRLEKYGIPHEPKI